MSQKVFQNFKFALDSNNFNNWFLGVLEPGRYRGFDSITTSTLSFTVIHTGTGIKQTKEDLTQTNETGILITKQGMVIQEDAAITSLTCVTNSGLSARVDLVVCTHEDVNTIGGQAATYSVIQGAPGGAIPSLPNPTKQTIVGSIAIPTNCTNLNTATYTPAQCPLLGGQNIFTNFPELDAKYPKLSAGPNAFLTQNQGRYSSTLMTVASNRWTPATNGNTYTNAIPLVINEIADIRTGLEVNVSAGTTITINLGVSPTAGALQIICPGLTTMGATAINMVLGDSIKLLNEGFWWRVMLSQDEIAKYLNTAMDDITVLKTLQGFAHGKVGTNHAVGPASEYLINLDTEVADPNAWFVPGASAAFTPQKAGYYKINTSIHFTTGAAYGADDPYMVLGFRKNGGSPIVLAASHQQIDEDEFFILNGSYIIYMNGSSDYLTLYSQPTTSNGGLNDYIVMVDSYAQFEFLGS